MLFYVPISRIEKSETQTTETRDKNRKPLHHDVLHLVSQNLKFKLKFKILVRCIFNDMEENTEKLRSENFYDISLYDR